MVGQPEYTVELVADTDFGVLISRDWLKWADESKPLIAGAHLYFRLSSDVAYKDKVNNFSVAVAGNVLIRDHLGRLVKVAHIDFERDESQGNPIVVYLQRHGLTMSAPTLPPNII